MTEAQGQTTYERIIADKFKHNWVFWLFSRTPIPYILLSLFISLAIFLIGAIFSAIFKAIPQYVANKSLYLNLLGITLALIAFGWFTRKLPVLLAHLSFAFGISDTDYDAILDKWANKIANRNVLMVLAAALFFIPNLCETITYWRIPNPPILLIPWVNSHASLYFAFWYAFLHVLLTSFILGSGIVGMIGVVCLIYDLFQKPLKLFYYRRTEMVIDLNIWLLMWALIGLASVVIFGRPFILFPTDILAINFSAIFQSIIATIIVLVIGMTPLLVVRSAIEKAKNKELDHLEKLHEQAHIALMAGLDNNTMPKLTNLREKIAIIEERLNAIKSIPTLPIRWPSIGRLSFGAVISTFSPFIREWVLNQFKKV